MVETLITNYAQTRPESIKWDFFNDNFVKIDLTLEARLFIPWAASHLPSRLRARKWDKRTLGSWKVTGAGVLVGWKTNSHLMNCQGRAGGHPRALAGEARAWAAGQMCHREVTEALGRGADRSDKEAVWFNCPVVVLLTKDVFLIIPNHLKKL